MKHISVRMAWTLLLFALCAPFFPQESARDTVAAADITLGTPEDAIRFDWDAAAGTQAEVPPRGPSSLGMFVRMVAALAVVAVILYGLMRLMRRALRPRSGDDPFLRRVSQVMLAPGKSVQVVTLFNHAYLVGVSDSAVSLIGEIADAELVDSMNLYADQQEGAPRPRSFEDILRIFTGRGARTEERPSSGAPSASDVLRQQRERLNREAEE